MRFFLPLSVLGCLVITACNDQIAGVKFSWCEPFSWIFPDQLEASPIENPVVDVARGGVAAAAFVLTGLPPGQQLEISADDPDCRFFEMIDVCVNVNTSEVGFAVSPHHPKSKSVIRDAPFREYDALKPLARPFTTKKTTLAVYCRIPVKSYAEPGLHPIKIRISAGEKSWENILTLRIAPVTLPAVGQDSVFFTNWFKWKNLDFSKSVEPWGEEFWRILSEHAAAMHSSRQNTFLVPLDAFFTYDQATRKFTLNEERLEKFIRLFTDAGLYWIEGGHFGRRAGDWTTENFKIHLSGNIVSSVEANEDVAQIGRLLMAFIRKHHLEARWIQHAADEPIRQNAVSYRLLCGMIRKYMPGIILMDANYDPNIVGGCDIWCTQVHEYEKDRAKYEAMRQVGDQLWAYTCCRPGGPWLNRLNDGELTRPMLLGWGCGHYGIEGFLHWGWNCYRSKEENPSYKGDHRQDPFEETAPIDPQGLPPGDTHAVYPGPNNEVWPSLRLESMRQGIEDWELIRMLKKRDPARCDRIVATVFRSFCDFDPDPAAITRARKELLDALSESTIPAVAPSAPKK